MTDPFATALAALFAAPGSVAAIYTPKATGIGQPTRVIRHQPSDPLNLEVGRTYVDGNTLSISRSDVPSPAIGDQVQIGSDALVVLADPALDAEGLSWMVQAA